MGTIESYLSAHISKFTTSRAKGACERSIPQQSMMNIKERKNKSEDTQSINVIKIILHQMQLLTVETIIEQKS